MGLSIDLWDAPKSISSQELKVWLILVLCFLSARQFYISFSAERLYPYAFKF